MIALVALALLGCATTVATVDANAGPFGGPGGFAPGGGGGGGGGRRRWRTRRLRPGAVAVAVAADPAGAAQEGLGRVGRTAL